MHRYLSRRRLNFSRKAPPNNLLCNHPEAFDRRTRALSRPLIPSTRDPTASRAITTTAASPAAAQNPVSAVTMASPSLYVVFGGFPPNIDDPLCPPTLHICPAHARWQVIQNNRPFMFTMAHSHARLLASSDSSDSLTVPPFAPPNPLVRRAPSGSIIGTISPSRSRWRPTCRPRWRR